MRMRRLNRSMRLYVTTADQHIKLVTSRTPADARKEFITDGDVRHEYNTRIAVLGRVKRGRRDGKEVLVVLIDGVLRYVVDWAMGEYAREVRSP